jgi:hypothetical protein
MRPNKRDFLPRIEIANKKQYDCKQTQKRFGFYKKVEAAQSFATWKVNKKPLTTKPHTNRCIHSFFLI